MIFNPEDFENFLENLFGEDARPLLQVRDSTSDIGWRGWIRKDTEGVCEWVTAKASEDSIRPNELICYNVKQAAELMGVSAAKFMPWLKRRDNPVPHIKEGRKYLIPGNLLAQWIKDEAARSIERRS